MFLFLFLFCFVLFSPTTPTHYKSYFGHISFSCLFLNLFCLILLIRPRFLSFDFLFPFPSPVFFSFSFFCPAYFFIISFHPLFFFFFFFTQFIDRSFFRSYVPSLSCPASVVCYFHRPSFPALSAIQLREWRQITSELYEQKQPIGHKRKLSVNAKDLEISVERAKGNLRIKRRQKKKKRF